MKSSTFLYLVPSALAVTVTQMNTDIVTVHPGETPAPATTTSPEPAAPASEHKHESVSYYTSIYVSGGDSGAPAPAPASSKPATTSSASASAKVAAEVVTSESSSPAPAPAPTTSSSSPVAIETSPEPTTSSEAPSPTTEAPSTTSSAPAETSSSSSDDNLSSFQKTIVDYHNKVRSQFGAGSLSWSDDLASYAQNYLDKINCQFQHSNGPYGENLAMGYSDLEKSMSAWFDEKSKYNWGAATFSENTGHFTQMIWKGTTQVGCAQSKCSNGNYLVCEYNPRGNVLGKFAQNV